MGMGRVAIFVFFALYFLRPVGFGAPSDNLALVCLGYALVTFVVGISYSFITERLLGWQRCGEGWTLGLWIIDCALLLLCISAGNFVFYNWLVGWTAFSGIVLAYVALPTVLIGLFPIAFSGMAIQLRAERENRKAAYTVSPLPGTGRPSVATTKTLVPVSDTLSLDPEAFLFAESRQNYVRLAFLREGNHAEETIRMTLSNLLEKLGGHAAMRCHRSYLVNPQHIVRAEGNAQGLRLTLVATEEEIPVSRAYVKSLRETVTG